MGKPFFTKKQKAKMKERRKKKNMHGLAKPNGGSDSANSNEQQLLVDSIPAAVVSKKRPRNDDDDVDEEAHEGGLPKETTTQSAANIDSTSASKSNGDATEKLTTRMMDGKLCVLLPSDLSAKDARKFRKDARRKLREQGKKIEEIEFVTSEEMPSLKPSNKKRKQKEFPSIKDLLKQKQQMEELKKEEMKLQEKLNMIPEAVRAQYVALDCEMVGIGIDGRKSALARVSMVDWNHDVVLDTFVKVPIRVTDFRTQVSGVEPKHIKHQNAMEVNECRKLVAKLLKDKILVGHALTNDLKALMLTHPKEKIRDTAKYRPFQRYGNGKWRPRKLRDLVKENLKGKEGFQEGEHDSVQDAKATMELFQLVYSQWEKELASKTK